MRVALTGVSGFIGSVIARHLAEHGHDVTGLVRETSRRDHVEAYVDRFVTGDQADRASWPALLDGADAVIHNSLDWNGIEDAAGLDRNLQSNLVASIALLAESAPRPFVFMSTIAVHHDIRPRWEGMIDEDHPLRPGTLYGACKAAVEAHLWSDHAQGRHTCAVRPCAVYGIDPRLARSHGYELIRKLQRGEPVTKPGGGKFVHVDDVAAVTVAALTHERAAGQPINMVDCYARWADWALMAQALLGTNVEIDTSSPPAPRNTFSKELAEALGVKLDRGHEGIRAHLEDLIGLMQSK
jgi:nucleoside-diphosphate-sugar epimerase